MCVCVCEHVLVKSKNKSLKRTREKLDYFSSYHLTAFYLVLKYVCLPFQLFYIQQ